MKIYLYEGKCNVSGQKIRELREGRRLSQEQLAAKMQVEGVVLNQKAISRIETGDRVVADYELMVFARVFNCDVNAFLYKADGE